MEIEELKKLLSKPSELVAKVQAKEVDLKSDVAYKEYEPETHKVMLAAHRPDKKVWKPTGVLKADGTPELAQGTEYVNRIPLALQKLIVGRAASFTATPVELLAKTETTEQETLLAMEEKTWEDNKLNYKTRTIAKCMMSEKECVELWNMEEAEPGYWGSLGNPQSILRMRVTILKPSEGNTFYPVFNNFGNMTAFGRGYKIKTEGKETEHLDLYTADFTYQFVSQDSGWVLEKQETNIFGKIPIIYYYQPRSEWADVEWAIERLEKLLSNFADTNDYFASPKVKVKGKVTGFASKGESGQIFELTDGAEMDYLTWNQAPEAIKLEIETLFDIIYTVTQTPNITFKEMKGVGNLSGIAIKLMFMDAHGKAKDKQDDYFGECIQRRVNLIKAGMAKVNITLQAATNLTITPKFELFMPENELEQLEIDGKKIENLSASLPGTDLIDLETAVMEHPYVKEPKTVLKNVKEEQAQKRVTLTI